jgi:hypothetical protein
MIWPILVALGIPLWVILGALASVVISRRRFTAMPATFPCKARSSSDEKWPRSGQQARWVRDVLLLHHGVALVRFDALAVDEALPIADPPNVKGLGETPVAASLRLEDGTTWEIAVADLEVLMPRVHSTVEHLR